MQNEGSGLDRLKELMVLALKTGLREEPPAPTAGTASAIEEKPLGLTKVIGGLGGGAIASIVSQAAPQSAAVSWLKWLNPIAGLIGLFTGGKKEEEPITPVMSPRQPKRYVEYGMFASKGGDFLPVDRDEGGRSRVVPPPQASQPNVVVQVQAIDSGSFLDHRDAIASAVKQALMESHGLGTVLGEFRE